MMNIVKEKAELKSWIDSITDEVILEEIIALKEKKQFDFEKEWARSITITDARSRSKSYISNLPWKK